MNVLLHNAAGTCACSLHVYAHPHLDCCLGSLGWCADYVRAQEQQQQPCVDAGGARLSLSWPDEGRLLLSAALCQSYITCLPGLKSSLDLDGKIWQKTI
jgi:hypothetical protein